MRTFGRLSRLTGLALLSLGMFAAIRPAPAMTFVLEAGEQGRRAVVARGLIEVGDAARLRTALQGADRDARGNKLLLLDSPGGPIVEAFAMVDVMDAERVSTRVRAGASCSSSCAMIVFVSGTFRTVDEGARLGVHTCYDAASGSRSMACNELIVQNALKHGVPYVTSLTMMQLTEAGEVRWFSATDAACWQLSRPEGPAVGQPPMPTDPAACPPPLATRVDRRR